MLSADAFPGFGGVIAEPRQVHGIWVRTGAEFKRTLADVYSETRAIMRDAVLSGETSPLSPPEVLAARVAQRGGRFAESQLLARPSLLSLGSGKFADLGRAVNNTYTCPLTGVVMTLTTSSSISWTSNIDSRRIEESPLLEAVFLACERVSFSEGYGGVHLSQESGADKIVWSAGDGALIFQPASSAAHS